MGVGASLQPQGMLSTHVAKTIWVGQVSSFLSNVLPPCSHQHLPLWSSHLLQVNCSFVFSKSPTRMNTWYLESYFFIFQLVRREPFCYLGYKSMETQQWGWSAFILPFYLMANPPPTNPLPSRLRRKHNRLAESERSAEYSVYLHMTQYLLQMLYPILVSESIFNLLWKGFPTVSINLYSYFAE